MNAALKPRLRVVDDHGFNLSLITTTPKEHCRIMVATGASEALRIAQQLQPDRVLLDILMPDLDGYTVCSRLKQDEDTRDIPVAFISSLDSEADAAKGLAAGAAGHGYKPFHGSTLLDCVRHHVRKR